VIHGMAFDGVREPSGGAQRVSGGQGWTGGDIRADYPAEAGMFAAREFTREDATHCQERTIAVRRITGSGLSVRRQKGREILLGDPHEGAQAVARRDGASLSDLLDDPQSTGLTTYRRLTDRPSQPTRCRPANRSPAHGFA
jgi:hypothetical protein